MLFYKPIAHTLIVKLMEDDAVAKIIESAVSNQEIGSIEKNTVESFGIRHNGCDLVRVRIEYPPYGISGTAELIKDKVIEYARTKLKDRLLSLPNYHTGLRAKYSFSIIEKSISESICYVGVFAEFVTNCKDDPIQKRRNTYLYSIKDKRFILPQYVLIDMLCEADKKRKKKIFNYLRRRGEWFIKRDELYAYKNGKSHLIGKLRVTQ